MKRFFLIISLFATLSLSASPIGAERAREIAEKFFSAGATRSTVAVEMAWAGSDLATIGSATRSGEATENATLYIYNRADKRGFVVVSGDDNVEKIIVAYSNDAPFDCTNTCDATKGLLQAWSDQIADARRAPRISATTRYDAWETGNIICHYETALWGQSTVGDNNVFNLCTPVISGKQTSTGCVATAMAILCYYYKWPKSVGTIEHDYYVNGSKKTETTTGVEYNYGNMLFSYNSGVYTDEQALAVSQLMWDCGLLVGMNYTDGSSGSNTAKAANALRDYFGYNKGSYYRSQSQINDKEWWAILKANLKKCGPMQYGGPGHAYIIDGYTDADYFHINTGNKYSAWYLLPNYTYYPNGSGVFDMVPDKDGLSKYLDLLVTQAITYLGEEINGMKISNPNVYTERFKVTAAIDRPNYDHIKGAGTIRLVHCDKNNRVKAVLQEKEHTDNRLMTSFNDVYLTKTVEEGDCLKLFYMGSDGVEREVFASSHDAYSEIFLCLTPEEVAEALKLEYSKSSRKFFFESRHITHYSVTDASGKEWVSGGATPHTRGEIDTSKLPSGTYTFSFATGGKPHTLTIKL